MALWELYFNLQKFELNTTFSRVCLDLQTKVHWKYLDFHLLELTISLLRLETVMELPNAFLITENRYTKREYFINSTP